MPPANTTLAQAERANGPEVQKRLEAWAKGLQVVLSGLTVRQLSDIVSVKHVKSRV